MTVKTLEDRCWGCGVTVTAKRRGIVLMEPTYEIAELYCYQCPNCEREDSFVRFLDRQNADDLSDYANAQIVQAQRALLVGLVQRILDGQDAT